MTSKQVLDALQRAWMNEKFAVQILPYEEPIVDMDMVLRVDKESKRGAGEKRLSAGEVPNLDSHEFVRAKENVAEFSISADHETIYVAAGSVHMFKYRDVEPLVLEGIVELI
ncbi:conserved hypothetical protein [Culex quinquefasciatus]|uniref:DNA replication complex GINS protein SLD5 C-terminal domain-containing protein n=1 Tax=Culex quinquefasciatus TaxID=7176 RepID=B0X8K2_CULQU|nr:conserved hypothetical protein [Culex quinquefasciatus]|eukprot:XP_001865962.1 conserved hypothetical protein [Culex quinquefasciatus]